ncbi:MAG: 3-oxoacyl-[acyl-carrier-protein] reductase [Sphingobacteriia bacterium]|nr:3-oxoacyl-[acyl-carrier-protein] reductase [Sphingobacteriia bacterium]
MHFDLTGKKVLLTGATGGIGSEIATYLLEHNAEVSLSGTNEQKLTEFQKTLKGKTHVFACNLSDTKASGELIDKAYEAMGGLDILICNAGVTKDGLAMRMTDEAFEEVVKVNLFSAFAMNRGAIKYMMKSKWGRIINISSVVGVSGNAGQANYSASKAGMIGMTKSIAQEAATRGITVNAVAPGFIATRMTDVLTQDQKDKISKNIPAGFMGEPSDIAAAVLFLASNEARYITGQTIHVNGGMLMV